jgi:hypothetical protein
MWQVIGNLECLQKSLDGAGPLGGVVDKAFRADGAGLGVDIVVGSLGAGDAGLTVPNGLIEGALDAFSSLGVDERSSLGASASC